MPLQCRQSAKQEKSQPSTSPTDSTTQRDEEGKLGGLRMG